MPSFIIPINDNRIDRLKACIANIREYFDNSEIVIAKQDDNYLFKRGQLINLAVPKTKHHLLVFQDVDMRWLRRIDIREIMLEINQPYIPFDSIMQFDEYDDKLVFRSYMNDKRFSTGGVNVFMREQFYAVNGFSNIPVGWGCEDCIMAYRVNPEFPYPQMQRIRNVIGHIFHEAKFKNVSEMPWHKYNYQARQTEKQRDKTLDGISQTEADEIGCLDFDGCKVYLFKNIRYSDDFAYKDLVYKP